MPRKRRTSNLVALNLTLAETHPGKLNFWDYKHNKISPHNLTFGCADLVWWICPQDPSHRWQQQITDFCKRQTDCMFCATRKLETNRSLADRYPQIAKEWHPRYNGHVTPETIPALADRLAYWRCKENKAHQWRSSIRRRTREGEGCPYCNQTTVSKKMSLAHQVPAMLDYWDWDSNPDISPQKIAADSSFVANFICPATQDFPRPHSFKMRIDRAVALEQEQENICPRCNRKEARQYGNFVEEFPDIASQWHKTKNGNMKPEQFNGCSSMLAWWQCPAAKDHEWRISIAMRTTADSGCPFCTGTQVSSTHSLARQYPELAAQWHAVKNGELTPDKIRPNSNRLIWWQCPEGSDHEWATFPAERVQSKTGCPFCAGQKIGLSNCLATVFPEIAEQWHRELNGKLKPEDVHYGSTSKAWWQCSLFEDHVWQAIVRSRTSNNTGCPNCISLRTPPEKSLQKLFPKIAKQWHSERNAPVTPLMVSGKTQKKYWWICDKNENHVYLTSVSNRTLSLSGCPYCSNQLINKENSLATQNPKLAKEWHKTLNGTLKPSQIAPKSSKKVWWQCPKGEDHVWQVSPSNRDGKKSGCPFCTNRRFSKTQSLQFQYPEIAEQWHPKRNGKLKPDQLKVWDTRSVWWQCPDHPSHEWQSKIMGRIKAKTSCPVCYNHQLYPGRTLADKYPEVAEEWHPSRNSKLTPQDVSAGSSKKVFWRCRNNQRHVWEATIANRTGNKSGCPHCWKAGVGRT
jgi:hypothetical protein